MKIDLRDKKIVIPIILFIGAVLLVVLLYKEDDNSAVIDDNTELITNVGNVSQREVERPIENKLDAYESSIREQREKHTAVNEIAVEDELYFSNDNVYTDDEIRRFEREKQLKEQERFNRNNNQGYVPLSALESTNKDDAELRDLMNALTQQEQTNNQPDTHQEDSGTHYDDMRKQYLFLDSLQKANDPALLEQDMKEERDREIFDAIERNKLSTLKVGKIANNEHFNSIKKDDKGEFIKAIIDEDVNGYAGSRIRIRLLEDVLIGTKLLKKNNYLYALISGFTEQRVKMSIVSVMYENRILPIRLSVYDVDGIEGMYVPSSQFREFTKELGGSAVQGVNVSSMNSENQFFQSMMQQVFQSTSSAVAKIIRKNKANIKYNSHVFLIDNATLEQSKNEVYEENKTNN